MKLIKFIQIHSVMNGYIISYKTNIEHEWTQVFSPSFEGVNRIVEDFLREDKTKNCNTCE